MCNQNPNTIASLDEARAFREMAHRALSRLDLVDEGVFAPAVTVARSLASQDHILSLINGRPFKLLRRHLALNGLTPDQYRARYGLDEDYRMVAPNYALYRRSVAVKSGLGSFRPGKRS